MDTRKKILSQQFCEGAASATMLASWPQFVIVDAIKQISRSDSLMQLRNINGSRNGKRVLHESGGNGNYPLKCDSATLAAIVPLGIAGSRGEICIRLESRKVQLLDARSNHL